MLTERQLFLFRMLVNDYIISAEPVGSRSISKREEVNFSSATIRNELADLEEMGFLKKPHSSAGRIPSEKGYRYYVDHLLSPALLTESELLNIKKAFTEQYYEFEKLIQETAGLLSTFSNYTSIVLGPELLDTRLKQLQIVDLGNGSAVMIIVTNTGHVENKSLTLPPDIDSGDIEKLVNILNEKLAGIPLYQLSLRVSKEIRSVMQRHIKRYESLLYMINSALEKAPIEHIYYGGKTNMMAQPEFKDIDKVLPLLNALEEKDFVHELLRSEDLEQGMQIKIGQENHLSAAKNCSVISATYTVAGEYLGTVAVIGPTRMAYPRVVSLMDIVTKNLSETLTGKRKKE